ncbi:MAG: RagB/SusD family nutrient uptake outer membrane protein [Tannerellaceae bacterium]|nr:RagB/SusD family nutrient uptake outer membrane protein [Tannerellaceae bacterium]
MKIKYWAIILLPFVGSFYSCSDFLQEDPKGNITTNYSMTAEGCERLVESLYNTHRDFLERLYLFGAMGADEQLVAVNGNDWRYFGEYYDTQMINNGWNRDFWRQLYNSLNVANLSIETVELAVLSEEKRTELRAEAHALRAFYMWIIVETYGDGAHFTVESTSGVKTEGYQPGVATFYRQILEDLNVATTGLKTPQASQWGRMNEGVRKFIQVKSLMSLSGYPDEVISQAGYTRNRCYTEALALTQSIRSDYNYRLLDGYTEIFDVDNQMNDEIIWSVQYSTDLKYNEGTANGLHRYGVGWYNKSAVDNAPILTLWSHTLYYGREYRWCMPSLFMIRNFSLYDKRLYGSLQQYWCWVPDNWDAKPVLEDTVLIRRFTAVSDREVEDGRKRADTHPLKHELYVEGTNHIYNLETGEPTMNGRSCYHTNLKLLDSSREFAKDERGHKDFIWCRLGEIYLAEAELQMYLGNKEEAAALINQLRARALMEGHGKELEVTPEMIDLDFILDENMRELSMEGFRWYTLKRTGKLYERAMKHNPDVRARMKPYHVNRPIPQNEVDVVTNKDEFMQLPDYRK